MENLQVIIEKIPTIFLLLISYLLIIYVGSTKNKFKNPFIFAIIISAIYLFKFLIYGVASNIDPDLLHVYYPQALQTLDGIDPLVIPSPDNNPSSTYRGGILWVLITVIPIAIYKSPVSIAIFIILIYLASILVFNRIAKITNPEQSTTATQIYSLLPLIWFNIRDVQDDGLVVLVFLSLWYLLITKNKTVLTLGASSFYLKFFTYPYLLFISFINNDFNKWLRIAFHSLLIFIAASITLSLMFSVNIIAYSIANASSMGIDGMSFGMLLRDYGFERNLIIKIEFIIMGSMLLLSLLVAKRKQLNIIPASLMFFISIYAGLYMLNPWYFSWFIGFVLMFYISKPHIFIPILIIFDIALRIWNIAENNWHHYKPLVYLSTAIVWLILMKCYFDASKGDKKCLT